MLRGLEIRDLLIIDRLDLQFQPGLNVLTGETGAGKSILLDALGFVLGWRGRAELVRSGANQGEVTAWFDLPSGHPAHHVLEEAGLSADGDLILRRVNTADGRKTAWINDRRCSGEVLRALSAVLVELHGQHDDRGLLNINGHRALLDAFAGSGAAQTATRAAWRALSAAQAALGAARAEAESLRAEEEFLRHAVVELGKLDPQQGEEAELDARRRAMQAGNRVREDIAKAYNALSLDGAEGQLGDAIRWLEAASDAVEGRLDAPLDALARALDALGEAEHGVAGCLDALSFDPHELERVEERLFAIRALARKHDVAPDDLGTFATDLRTRLEALDNSTNREAGLQQALDAAQITYDHAAGALTKVRQTAAARLDKAMATELAPLKMERAIFATKMSRATPGPDGVDEVAFTVATNPGAPAGPLNKIASGGELSRFLLALKVCLTAQTDGLTLIFDEIDRGVGGATADAVGRRLKSLASDAQILVVTHSPQVAALGNHHWRVEKQVQNDQTTSTVVPLAPDDRITELARMLAGDTITDAARAAAKALLSG
ncbi:DNA repair protein RecN [Actibacterium sp. 188UL27-1]|uniref:DNA repair protein RecN n=1 Tax=Actibacterium sp. 188UL27-1 TaxID=2786961 RepID=UPI00195AD705|nr:DNA repair protein RecN [Actibacterium sp. 188UL27-1]MBM7068911.1 DNA repair protein RecN [Actibacterium sp. 188UL27-1]